jgi:Putative Ig domain/Bacterial Ig domain
VGTEAGVQATQAFTLTVREAAAFTSPTSSAFTLGVAGSFQVMTRGYPVPTLTRTGSLPGGLTFDAAPGLLSGTPATGTIGTYKLTLKATNGIGTAAQQTLTITVTKRSTSVAAVCAPDLTVPGSATTCTATVADASPGTKSAPSAAVTWSVINGSGKLNGASCKTVALTRVCTVTYTPTVIQTVDQRLRASYAGDTSHGTSTGDVVSRLIVATADAYATALNNTLSIAAPGVLANDRNIAGGSAALLAGPLHGSLVLRSDGSFTYTPAHGYRGKDGFAYRVKLGSVWSLPTVVGIAVGQ